MNTEAKTQQEIVRWFRNNYCLKFHDPRCVIFSVPNESRNARENMQKKATGLMAGVSDLIVVLPGKVLFVEVKTDTGRKSKNQKTFKEIVSNLGFDYFVVRSLEEFKHVVYRYCS